MDELEMALNNLQWSIRHKISLYHVKIPIHPAKISFIPKDLYGLL